ncbi:MAG: TetR/AcrR family transcriptional regulator [Bacteroidota bacterium]
MPRIVEFKEEEVLRSAMVVFWEKGYSGTSMQDLVDATGLNRSSLYNSFGSKLALYQETLRRYAKETGTVFQKALLKAQNPLEAVQFIFEGFLPEILDKARGKGCFAPNCKAEMANQEDNIKQWLLRMQEDSLNLFTDLIAEGQKQGLFNKDQGARDYAYYVFSAFQGFRMTGILVKDETILLNIIASTIQVLK